MEYIVVYVLLSILFCGVLCCLALWMPIAVFIDLCKGNNAQIGDISSVFAFLMFIFGSIAVQFYAAWMIKKAWKMKPGEEIYHLKRNSLVFLVVGSYVAGFALGILLMLDTWKLT